MAAALPGIPLPRWLSKTFSHQYNGVDVVLLMALSLANHGTAQAIRALAHQIKDKVQLKTQPHIRALARLENDTLVLQTALNIVQLGTDRLGIHPGKPFPIKGALMITGEPPRCHMKPMRLAGSTDTRHWACQHCSHIKPLEHAG